MGTEIERKFLVSGDGWRGTEPGPRIRQGYLSLDPARAVRVRTAGERAWLTVKGALTGLSRPEFDYAIPLADACQMLDDLCHQPLIDKTRYKIRHGDHLWEVDEFHGANDGLVIAEVELGSESESFARPPWLGPEVSDDPRYFNINLFRHPYRNW